MNVIRIEDRRDALARNATAYRIRDELQRRRQRRERIQDFIAAAFWWFAVAALALWLWW